MTALDALFSLIEDLSISDLGLSCKTPEAHSLSEDVANISFVSINSLKTRLVYITETKAASEAIDYLLTRQTTLGVDIETSKLPGFENDKQAGLDPRKSCIRTVQLYAGDSTVFVFDLFKLGGVACLGSEIWKRPMVAHNALFELKHLMHAGVYPLRLGCSLIADRVINGDRVRLRADLKLSRKATLKDLSKELLNVEVSKELQDSDWTNPDLTSAQLEYAALDAVLVSKIFSLQLAMLEKESLTRAYRVQRDAQHAVARMELTGIGFDVEAHRQMLLAWSEEAERLKLEILSALGQELNINSGKQLSEWLTEALKQEDLEKWAKTDKGQLSTSTHTFKLHEHMHDVFPRLVQYRHVAKRISSFGESLYRFIDVSKNRLYGSFVLGSTSTGRMASRAPNMQQMPREGFRRLFVAEEGYQLIRLDYSQQELRVAALVTGDKALLKIYADGGDIHKVTAAALLKIPVENVGKEQRQLAKAVIFGLLYGQGAKGLAVYAKNQYGVDMSVEEAEKYRAALFRTYRGMREWQRKTGDTVHLTMKTRTPGGRIRDFSREQNGYQYTASLNHPIQGAAAEITLGALARLTPVLCDDIRLVNVVHDEILLEVKEAHVEEVMAVAKDAMEKAFLDVFPTSQPYLKGLVEASVGKNWEEAY